MPAQVDREKCTGCESCVEICPVEAIKMVDGKAKVSDECVDCGQCVDECPVEAIEMK
jgi:Fe-S-cluster-containing hydrogenase component 2